MDTASGGESEGRRDEDEPAQEQGRGDERLQVEPVADRGEAGAFERTDEAREVPDRERVRGGAALLDLAPAQSRREPEPCMADRRPVRPRNGSILDLPAALGQARAGRVDPFYEPVVGAEAEPRTAGARGMRRQQDRTSVGQGKSVSVRVDLGG